MRSNVSHTSPTKESTSGVNPPAPTGEEKGSQSDSQEDELDEDGAGDEE